MSRIRARYIADCLDSRKRFRVKDVAAECDVSTRTIRNDMKEHGLHVHSVISAADLLETVREILVEKPHAGRDQVESYLFAHHQLRVQRARLVAAMRQLDAVREVPRRIHRVR